MVLSKAGICTALSQVALQKARKQVGDISSDMFQHCPFPQIPGQLGGPSGRSHPSLVDPAGPPSFLLAKSVLVRKPWQWRRGVLGGARTHCAGALVAVGGPSLGQGFRGRLPRPLTSLRSLRGCRLNSILTLMEEESLVIGSPHPPVKTSPLPLRPEAGVAQGLCTDPLVKDH